MARREKIFATVASVAVLAAVAFGFWTLGSPLRHRESAQDSKRVANLVSIAREIGAQWTRKDRTGNRRLPVSLQALVSVPGAQPLALRDPVTGVPYEYRPRDGPVYELCATFARASNEYVQKTALRQPTFWAHSRGRWCFVLDASRSVPR